MAPAPKRKGLGKGLQAYIPEKNVEKSQNNSENTKLSTNPSTKAVKNVDKPTNQVQNGIEEAQYINITKVERNPAQPRLDFDEEALQELADSIKQYGIIQPLLVKPVGKRFIIVAGERRWRAAKLAGLKKVPAIVKDYTDAEIMEISLIENIQREDLNVIEEALAYQKLLSEFGYRQEDLAAKLSRSRTAITNRIRLLKLPQEVLDLVKSKQLSEGHARTLLGLPEESQQIEAAKKVVEARLSVRETEQLVKQMLTPSKEKKSRDFEKDDSFIYEKLEEDLRALMGTKVAIQRKDKYKGKIIIDYYSTDELERIMDIIKK